MSVALYFDHNMPFPLAAALRQRGIDVLTADEDGTHRWDDRLLWQRATNTGRILVTQDHDFLQLAQEALASEQTFTGLIFCHISDVPISELIDDLELAATLLTRDELSSTVIWIPL